MKTYCVVITDKPNDPLAWEESREVETTGHRDAGLLAFTLSPHTHPARSSFRKGGPVRAWVWLKDSPKHPNGAPICVHALDLTRGEPAPV